MDRWIIARLYEYIPTTDCGKIWTYLGPDSGLPFTALTEASKFKFGQRGILSHEICLQHFLRGFKIL